MSWSEYFWTLFQTSAGLAMVAWLVFRPHRAVARVVLARYRGAFYAREHARHRADRAIAGYVPAHRAEDNRFAWRESFNGVRYSRA